MSNNYVPYKKGTLLIPSGTLIEPNKRHLFVILTDRCSNYGHMCVPISTIKSFIRYDDACVVPANSHEFITEDSFVLYRFAETRHFAHISKNVGLKFFIPKADVSDTLFQAICDGVHRSRFISPRMREYFNLEFRPTAGNPPSAAG